MKGRPNEEKNNETEINEVLKLLVYYESINREIKIRTDVCGIFDGYSTDDGTNGSYTKSHSFPGKVSLRPEFQVRKMSLESGSSVVSFFMYSSTIGNRGKFVDTLVLFLFVRLLLPVKHTLNFLYVFAYGLCEISQRVGPLTSRGLFWLPSPVVVPGKQGTCFFFPLSWIPWGSRGRNCGGVDVANCLLCAE